MASLEANYFLMLLEINFVFREDFVNFLLPDVVMNVITKSNVVNH